MSLKTFNHFLKISFEALIMTYTFCVYLFIFEYVIIYKCVCHFILYIYVCVCIYIYIYIYKQVIPQESLLCSFKIIKT